MKPRDWYRLTSKAGNEVAELHIFGEIGGGWFADEDAPTGKRVAKELAALPDSVKAIKVRVNSPGGAVFDGLQIANALRRESREKNRTVEVEVEGLAASAATLITSAGDVIRMPKTALMMVHDPFGAVHGTAKDMRSIADALDRISTSIVAAYKWVSPKSEDELRALMTATTFMDADEALANGFVTEITEGIEAAALFDLEEVESAFGTVPDRFRPLFKAKATPPAAADPKAVIQACKAAGFPELADDLLNLPTDQVAARLEEKKAAKAAAEARATEIRGLCQMALSNRTPEFIASTAEDYIAGGMATSQIKSQLTRFKAELASVPIDNRQPAEADADPAKGWAKAIAKVQGTRTKGA